MGAAESQPPPGVTLAVVPASMVDAHLPPPRQDAISLRKRGPGPWTEGRRAGLAAAGGRRVSAGARGAPGGVAPPRSAVSPFILCSALTVGRGTLGLQEDRVPRPPAARTAPRRPQAPGCLSACRSSPSPVVQWRSRLASFVAGIVRGGHRPSLSFLPTFAGARCAPGGTGSIQPSVKGPVALLR